jgi:hypothetical protein
MKEIKTKKAPTLAFPDLDGSQAPYTDVSCGGIPEMFIKL